ncbi:MAG: EAL domain-containing protein [Oscillospiraceae bacterium]|nr:EAL domain-containing protein [Oscillospiraceae bacterium]
MPKRMNEQELLLSFKQAMTEPHIFVCYQPKMNYATGRMIGAEALMRWKHPEYGMQYPSDFIPVLEKNGLLPDADLAVFELVCRFQRRCLDENIPIVPISFNMSRYDILQHNYVGKIEQIRQKYQIPVRFLHVEITESSAIGGAELVVDVLKQLHCLGYVVEMDDFGSGYSSLNILKDLEVDVIKLDMRFLSSGKGGRGGAILSSVVQMSKWLDTPVIAEGVETIEQADYMKSIGCSYIQGYLFSKPITEEEFIEKLKRTDHEPVQPPITLIESMDAGKFWNPNSLETLIFNHYVGGAAIFSYQDGEIQVLRVNEKYMKELGMNMCEKDILNANLWEQMDDANHKIYETTLRKAIQSREEESCDTWRTVSSKICGEQKICIRNSLRMIGRAGEQYLFYTLVQNITAEKKRFEDVSESERKFRFAAEHANIYAWEYTVATKQMRPCYRCMRDLGLPPVVENYPEPVIENGIFPEDYADMYRDWHRQIAEGVPHLEAIIPLTVGRVPFHVRYTTEFDENGKPLKAYASATMVVDGEDEEKQD